MKKMQTAAEGNRVTAGHLIVANSVLDANRSSNEIYVYDIDIEFDAKTRSN